MLEHVERTKIEKLVRRTRSYLRVYDEAGLLRYLRSSWRTTVLIKLLAHDNAAEVKVAATCLGILGDPIATSALIAALPYEDAVVTEMAEFALWTIWFKERGPAAEALLRTVPNLGYTRAIEVLNALVDKYPDWAEPYNQRAIVNYEEELFVSAADDCRETLSIQPHHFGAWAGLGHSNSQLGLYSEAFDCYRRALEIHPRLGGVRQSLRSIRQVSGNAPAP